MLRCIIQHIVEEPLIRWLLFRQVWA